MNSLLFSIALISMGISLILLYLSFADYRDSKARKRNSQLKPEPGSTPENPLIVYIHAGERRVIETHARFIAIASVNPTPVLPPKPTKDPYEPQDTKRTEIGLKAGARPPVPIQQVVKQYATTVKKVADDSENRDHMADRFDKKA